MSGQLRLSILERHDQSLHGKLKSKRFFSKYLCHFKYFYIYEPPGVTSMEDIPIVFLFRGHEREWVNFDEDPSRQSTTAIEDVDFLICEGALPPAILVMPGLNSADNHIPSLGINMQGRWPVNKKGLGAGKFWLYLTKELFPFVENNYPCTKGGKRLSVGFSLGGFTVSLLGVHYPNYFDSLGIYDGLFMWPKFLDPRVEPNEPYNDNVWLGNPLFDAAFGKPRKRKVMNKWNPTDTLLNADHRLINQLRHTKWWITSAPGDGNTGNKDRTEYFVDALKNNKIPLGFDFIVFDEHAVHNWHWTDRFLYRFLQETLL